MSIISQSLKSICLIIIGCIIAAYLPVLAAADTGASSSETIDSVNEISIKLEAEPRLQAPIRTHVAAAPQVYRINFPQAMNKASVEKVIQSQSKEVFNPTAADLFWDFVWESPQILKVKVTVSFAEFLGYSGGEYSINVNGSKTVSNQVIAEAQTFAAIPTNPIQLWGYAVDGSSRELLTTLDEPYNLSKLQFEDRYYLAARGTQYCECDASYEGLYALYDIQEHKLIPYSVVLQTNYEGKGDFVVDRRGFFYEQPEKGVAVPLSNSTQTIHVKGYVHGASFSKDGKHIIMAVGTEFQEKDLAILLYSLDDQTIVTLAKSLKGWLPINDYNYEAYPLEIDDTGKFVYFRLTEQADNYKELRYAYSWSDRKFTTWKPPFEMDDKDWTAFTSSSDETYQLYVDGSLYRKAKKMVQLDEEMQWQWIKGTHILTALDGVRVNVKNEQYTSEITLFNADDLSIKKLYSGLFYNSYLLGSSLDGHSIIVEASNSVVDANFPPIGFGQADDWLMNPVYFYDDSSLTYYINDAMTEIVNPPHVDYQMNELWIPLKEVLTATGWQITWSAENQTISGVKAGYAERKFQLKLNQKKGLFNGTEQDLTYAPIAIKGVTYIYPGILQKLSMKLDWDITTRVLRISDKPDVTGITFADGSRFEGVIHEGVPDGFGRLFNRLGQLIYEGEFAAGKYQGQGKFYDESGKEKPLDS